MRRTDHAGLCVATVLWLAATGGCSSDVPPAATDASIAPDALDATVTADTATAPPDAPEGGAPDTAGQGDADAEAETLTSCDRDGDGVLAPECGGGDCDDRDRARYPGNPEVCDSAGRDEDCNPCTVSGAADDGDGDGDTVVGAGCFNPYVGVAPQCDPGRVRIDGAALRVTGRDCDDTNANVRPNQTESCNGVDDNCDGTVDEGVARTFYLDADGDGFGDAMPGAATRSGCTPPAGFVENNTDCNDTSSAINPSAREVCDRATPPVDENCDGRANPNPPCACGDGEDRACALPGACGAGRQRCVAGTWGACSISPSPEVCDGVDNDCNGVTDEFTAVPPGMSPPASAITPTSCGPIRGGLCRGGACACPAGQSNCSGTCAPTGAACEAGIGACRQSGTFVCRGTGSACSVTGGSPSTEVCNGRDDNCNGSTDEGWPQMCYTGRAGTAGRGPCRAGFQSCSGGALSGCVGEVTPNQESCNGADDDCDGVADNGFACRQGSTRTQTAYFDDRIITCTQACNAGCGSYASACTITSPLALEVRGNVTSFWSYNSPFTGVRNNERDLIVCGIRSGYMVYGPYRRFSPGRYRVQWTGRVDSAILDFDIRNADSGATLSAGSVSRGLGGTWYTNPSTEVTIPREWGPARVEFRVYYRNGSNAFACSTFENFRIELIGNVFTL